MKKFLLSFIALICNFALCLSPCAFASYVDNFTDIEDDLDIYSKVFVSSAGSDSALGSEADPFLTLERALDAVLDGGTIHISGTLTLSSSFNWVAHDKSVIIEGGTLNASAISAFNIRDNATFQNMTLTFASGGSVYANGYKVTFGEGLTNTNSSLNLFGGSNGGTISSTDLTVLSGNYTKIHGGSRGGSVTGNTKLFVGGTTNSACDATSHSGTYQVFGGGHTGTIGGSTYFTFADSAKANYIYGGSNAPYGTTASIGDSINITMAGGRSMSIYGGCIGPAVSCDVNLTMTGGEVEQVFGGSNSASSNGTYSNASLTGNVTLKLLGGKITRRVYGGCYNEYTTSGWLSSNYVIGKINLIIGGGVSITFSATEPGTTTKYADLSLYAHSRQKTNSSTEVSAIIFDDATAYSTYKSKVKYHDSGLNVFKMIAMLGSLSAADSTHYYTYSASGATITETCAVCNTSKTAVLSVDESVSRVYTGKEIKPIKLTCNFEYEPLSSENIAYSNNINAGTASASISRRTDSTATISFASSNAELAAPTGISATNETIKGKADGKISGLTTAMEISTNGSTYTAVTNPDASFAAGVYYVRFPAKTNYNPSPAATVTIAAGRALTVTFKAEGSEDIVKEVSFGETLTDIPEIPSKEGFTETAPTWDITDFSNIQTDITANAVYRFTVTFLNKNGNTIGKIASSAPLTDVDLTANGIAAPAIFGYDFLGWSEDYTAIGTDTKVTATYKRAESEALNLTITLKSDGEVVKTAEATFDEALKATAKEALDDGRVFSHWENEAGDILSLSPEYSFYAPSSITLSAVYADAGSVATEVSAIVINENPLYSLDNGNFSVAFTAKSEAPSGATILEKGLVIGGINYNEAPASLTLDSYDLLGKSTNLDSTHFMITLSEIKQGKTRNARAYIVYELDGVTYTKYSRTVIRVVTSADTAAVSTHSAEN